MVKLAYSVRSSQEWAASQNVRVTANLENTDLNTSGNVKCLATGATIIRFIAIYAASEILSHLSVFAVVLVKSVASFAGAEREKLRSLPRF